MSLRPVAREDEIVVQLVNLRQTKGGIILPNAPQEYDTRFAQVVSVGPGAILPGCGGYEHSQLKEGEIVILQRNRGTPFIFGGKPYVYLSMHEIPVVIRGDGIEVAPVPSEDMEPVEKATIDSDYAPSQTTESEPVEPEERRSGMRIVE